jgi:hypothetical protein
MKTVELGDNLVTLELTEFELTVLAALVEQGQLQLSESNRGGTLLHSKMMQVASEFRSLLGHLDLHVESA